MKTGQKNYLILSLLSSTLALSSYSFVYATTINTSPANTGHYTHHASDSLTIDANIIETLPNGSGGSIQLSSPSLIMVNRGRLLDVSATSAGHNGGTINLSAPALVINGILRANGYGHGAGGSINLSTSAQSASGNHYVQIGNEAVLEAKGGANGGLGGVINILGDQGASISIAHGARIETSGVSSADANMIRITGDGESNNGVALQVDGDIITNSGDSGSAGTIVFQAEHGNIETASTAHITADSLLNGSGGNISFNADQSVIHHGVISASGLGDNTSGGDISIIGNKVIQHGDILAEGGEAGQGGHIDISSTEKTILANGSVTSARGAAPNSDAGSIRIWSDGNTYFNNGSLLDVSGGSASGNGGFVEISAKDSVFLNGQSNGDAVNGIAGSILIDPTNITISNAGGNAVTGGDCGGCPDETFAEDSGANVTYNPQAGGAFNGFNNIWLQATNDITVSSAFNVSTATGKANVSLELDANNNIIINAPITATNTITLKADYDGNNAGSLTIGSAGSITGTRMTLTGYAINIGGPVVSSSSRVVVISTGAFTVDGSTGGYIQAGGATGSAGSETLSVTAGGAVQLIGGSNANTGSLIATTGNVRVDSPSSLVTLIGAGNTDTGMIRAGDNVVVNSGLLSLNGGSGQNSGSIVAANNVDITANGLSGITWNGPDGMLFSTTGQTVFTGTQDDEVRSNLALGMTFNFFGTNYTTVSPSSNGFLWFGNVANSQTNAQSFSTLPVNGSPKALIYGTDLDPSTGGTWGYSTSSNTFVMTYNDIHWWNQTSSLFNGQIALLNTGNALNLPTGSIVTSFGNTVAGFADPGWGANPAFASGINKGSGSLYQTLNPLGIGQSTGVLSQAEESSLAGRAFVYIPNGTGAYTITELGTASGQGGVSTAGGGGTLSGAISSTSGTVNITANNAITTGTGSSTNSGRIVATTANLTSTNGSINANTNVTNISVSSGLDSKVTDTDNITVTSATVGRDMVITAGSSGSTQNITLQNANVTRNTTLQAGGTITATSNNRFTGSLAVNGEAGSTDYAASATVTDIAGDFDISRVVATNGTFTAGSAAGNLTVTGIDTNDGTLSFVAPVNITMSTNTVNNSDTIWLNTTSNGNVTLSGNTITSLTGTAAAPSGSGGVRIGTAGSSGDITLTNNVINNGVQIGTSGALFQGNITGTGNTFKSTTGFFTSASKDISITTSDFQNTATNDFQGRNITLSDPTSVLYISSAVGTSLTASATQATTAGDLTVLGANITGSSNLTAYDTLNASAASNVDFGLVTATTTNASINIVESTPITLGLVTNNSASSTTSITTTGGAITGKGTSANDLVTTGSGLVTLTETSATGYISLKVSTAGGLTLSPSGKDTVSNKSIYLYGSVGGNISAWKAGTVNTLGDIVLGDWETGNTLNVTGSTSFKSATDALGYGNFTGTVSGNGNRVSWWQTGTTNLTISNLTASATGSAGTEFFTGYNNILNLYVPKAAVVGTSGTNLTATNGAITVWAGDSSTGSVANSYIQLTGISTTKDAYFWAGGKNGSNKSIDITAGTITGSIDAVSDTYGKTVGDINISLNSGSITTRDVATGGNLTLTSLNGNILQNNAYNFADNMTVYATGNATLQAGDAAGDTASYVDTGIYVQGNANLLAAGKNGSNLSVRAYGRVDGNTVVQNYAAGAVTGDVYLGTSLGNPDQLNDVDTVFDGYGNITINSARDVYLNGAPGVNGWLTITGKTLTIRQDIGDTRIGSISTTATTGTAIDIQNYGNQAITGDSSGTDITTASTSNVILRAGNAYPSDANAYITNLNVNIGGNLTAYVAGDSNGTNAGGVSVNITGTITGTQNAYDETGGSAPRGSVTMPP